MITALNIYKEARNLGSTKTLSEVQTVLKSIDRTKFESTEQSRYKIEIWDKVTEINGLPANELIGRIPEGGQMYMIYIDSNLVFLQPHDPEQAGLSPMSTETATQKAQNQVNKLIEQSVDQQVMNEALMQLL